MDEITLGQIIGPVYLLLGLSLLLYAPSWKKLVEKFKEDHLSLFGVMLVYAVLGSILINAYNEWTWDVWLIITLTGWILAIKAVFYFLLPGSVIKKIIGWKANTTLLYIGGLVCAVVGVALSYYSYFIELL